MLGYEMLIVVVGCCLKGLFLSLSPIPLLSCIPLSLHSLPPCLPISSSGPGPPISPPSLPFPLPSLSFCLVAPPADKVDTTNTPEDIQRQQADLQAKILSLLGSNAVVPSSSPSAPPKPPAHRGQTMGSGFDSTAKTHSAAGAAVTYPQQSYQNSGGYRASYGSGSEAAGGYGATYGAYNYR